MKKSKKTGLKIISIILIIICLISLGVFSHYLLKLNVVPTKYLGISYGIIGLFLLLLIFCLIKGKTVLKITSLVLITLLSSVFGFGTNYVNNTYKFISNTQVEYDTLSFSVISLKESEYDNLKSLKNKTISYLDNEYTKEIQKELSNIKYAEVLVQEFGLLPDKLLDLSVDAIILEDSYLSLLYEEVENFSENTEVIYSFELREKAHQEENKDVIDIEDEPFIVYISGIDQYGNISSVRGRSDVNMIAVINPKTHHILLVNTPRDYYVQLAGTRGYKDKLTHAGIYGIDKSINTLEQIYSIDINHYLRVNFNTLIKLVDVIGGLDIYSDSSFICWTNRKVKVEEGWNHFNGEQALAYARERFAYKTGDHHRGANQQQIITAIIEKVTNSTVLISKYNTILNTLNGSFQTDMPMDTVTSFIRYQLDKMPDWTVESTAVTGTGSSEYTYSMGTNYKLYVMLPDYNSIETVKTRINEVLNENLEQTN